MKKINYILPFVVSALMACGGGDGQTGEEAGGENAATEESIEGVATDLTEYGMPYSITLPEGGSGELTITATDWGGVEINKGDNFRMSIAYGEGDLDLLKFDLEEDLVYKAEIIEEADNYVVYKREIPDSGMDAEYHFMYVVPAGDEAIEITNSKDVTHNEEAIRKMLASAKSFKANGGA